MPWPSHPADIMIGVKLDPFLPVLLTDNLHSIIANKNCACSTLPCICLHGFLYREYGGSNGKLERLFVNRHLDGDVWEALIDVIWRRFKGRIKGRVLVVLVHWPEDQANIAHQLQAKKLGVWSVE